MLNLDALRIFCNVVEAGGFSRAADRLGISTSSVTNQVAALELGFRAKLLHRTTRSMSLTDEGRQCYEAAVKLLGEAEELEQTMRDLIAAPSGMLHVDMPGIFNNLIVAPALPQFSLDYPEISVRLTANDRFVDMVEEGIDVLVRVGNLNDSQLVSQRLATTQWICCAAPAYIAKHGRPASPDALAGFTCLNFIYPKSGRFRPWTFLRDQQATTMTPLGRVGTDHVEGMIEAAVAGGGVMHALSVSVQDKIARGLLIPLLEEFTAPGPDIHVIFQQRHLRAARVKVFVDFLHQAFAARVRR